MRYVPGNFDLKLHKMSVRQGVGLIDEGTVDRIDERSIYFSQVKDGKWRKTTINIRTVNTVRLPLRDIAVYDVGDESEEFGIDIGAVCFS